jgi:hypothetical protein
MLALDGYDTHFAVASDTDLWSRLAGEHPFLMLPEPLIEYRIHDNNVSSTRVFEMREMSRWITMRRAGGNIRCGVGCAIGATICGITPRSAGASQASPAAELSHCSRVMD